MADDGCWTETPSGVRVAGKRCAQICNVPDGWVASPRLASPRVRVYANPEIDLNISHSHARLWRLRAMLVLVVAGVIFFLSRLNYFHLTAIKCLMFAHVSRVHTHTQHTRAQEHIHTHTIHSFWWCDVAA